MSNEQTNITTATESAAPITAPEAEPFALVKKIGKTTYKAVSYTHLDVYKRQRRYFMRRVSSEAGPH